MDHRDGTACVTLEVECNLQSCVSPSAGLEAQAQIPGAAELTRANWSAPLPVKPQEAGVCLSVANAHHWIPPGASASVGTPEDMGVK